MDRLFVTIALLLAIVSCSKEGVSSGSWTDFPDDGLSHGQIVLGDRLENPYTTENISAAIASVYPTRGRVEVEPTHLYVRFLPVDQDEFDLISDLDLSDHPLDYAIVKDGDYYHDPQIGEDNITWQYAVVPVDYVFPDVYHELIDECYITENDAPERSGDGIDWEAVEREAYRLTGNGDMLAPETRANKVNPSGRITIVDDQVNGGKPFGLAGVRVRCNTFVKYSHAYTDRDGYYTIPQKYSAKVRYRLIFKNEKGFAIGFNKLLVPASTSALGKSSPSGLDYTVTKDSDRKMFTRSVVNNAAYEYIASPSPRGRGWGGAAFTSRPTSGYGYRFPCKVSIRAVPHRWGYRSWRSSSSSLPCVHSIHNRPSPSVASICQACRTCTTVPRSGRLLSCLRMRLGMKACLLLAGRG